MKNLTEGDAMELATGVCVCCLLCSLTALVLSVICMRQANEAADRTARCAEEVVRLSVGIMAEVSGAGKPSDVGGPHGNLTVFNPEGGAE